MKNKLKRFLTKENILNRKNFIFLSIFILFFGVAFFRFQNLGYSEFQDDEKKARFLISPESSWQDFLLSQRKGPLQFIFTLAPILITKDPLNEFSIRFPFALSSFLASVVLYLIIFKLTKSHLASFFVVGFFSINGFMVGFGRIAQYQNLNILFSFLAILFTIYLTKNNTKIILYSILAGGFYGISFLAHWDAVYYAPILLYLGICFLRRKDLNHKIKIKAVFGVLVSFMIFLLPFLIPYLQNLTSTQNSNLTYLNSRVGVEGSEISRHYEIFKLYNPFVTEYFLIVGFVISVFFFRKTFMFISWSILSFLAIKFFMTTPKTHIYNYLIPLTITSTLGFYFLYEMLIKNSKKFLKIIGVIILLSTFLTLSFLTFQSYTIFIDTNPEYPWNAKKVLWFKAPEVVSNEVITFGFPYKRGYKEISKIIPENCKFQSNENKSMMQIYIKGDWGNSRDCFYYIRVKKPFDLDGKKDVYPGLKDSKKVYEYTNFNETQTQVYKLK
ncbi:hypothetical protein EBU91_00830 [bacterium]|nr:hypothetical protein [bacterium]